MIYSYTGTIQLESLTLLLTNFHSSGSIEVTSGLIPGVSFLLAGLFFKIYAFPFHSWVPDIYEGSPTPTALFFASAPKIIIVGLIIRLAFGPFYEI